jgi:hypothetical protein
LFSSVNTLIAEHLWTTVGYWAHPNVIGLHVPYGAFQLASSNDKLNETVSPSHSNGGANDTSRARSIATRLTDIEFGEVEEAAAQAGKKMAEWLREAALTHARVGQEETDPILLAEIMGMRNLMLNLFAKASQGPLSIEDIRKMSAYSDSIKEPKAEELLTQRRRRNTLKTPDKVS